jgi:hypothetical protein
MTPAAIQPQLALYGLIALLPGSAICAARSLARASVARANLCPEAGEVILFVIESLHEPSNDEIGSRLEIKRLFLIRIVSVNDVDDYEQYDHGDYEPDSEHFQP